MTKRRILFCVLAFYAGGCGDAPPVGKTTSDLCVLDPATVTQRVHVVRTSNATPNTLCAPVAEQTQADGFVDVKLGRIIDAPIQLTGVTSYDGVSVGARCVYDLVGFAEVEGPSCSFLVDFTARVLVP